jgi:hypothetical protein
MSIAMLILGQKANIFRHPIDIGEICERSTFSHPTGPPWVEKNDTLQALEFAAKELKVDIFRDFARRFPHFFGSNLVSFTSFTMRRGDMKRGGRREQYNPTSDK